MRWVILSSFVWAGLAHAQESRGSITGKVTDPQGAVIPAAAVTATNIETNAASKTATNETGYFEINLLNPGSYTLTVEAAGFKKSVRTGLVLNVAGRLDIETQLQVGQLAETVEVTAAAPLLDTTTASGGRVIDNRQIMQLPFADLNPFALSALTPGMMWTGQPEYNRPFDNGGTSSFNTMGGVGQNEYTIDGAPATGTGHRVAFVRPSDAVEEFKLETTTFDASYGHTSGATINVMTKAGTNAYHGSLYEQHWQQRWNATSHFTRLAWERDVREGRRKSSDPKQAPGGARTSSAPPWAARCACPSSTAAATSSSSFSATTASIRRRPRPPARSTAACPKWPGARAISPTSRPLTRSSTRSTTRARRASRAGTWCARPSPATRAYRS